MISQMCGVMHAHDNVDYIISERPIQTLSKAMVVDVQWIYALASNNALMASPNDYTFEALRSRLTAPEAPPVVSNETGLALAQPQKKPTYRELSQKFHLSFRDISKMKHAETSDAEPKPRPPRGRPSKQSPELVAKVRNSTIDNPYLGSRGLAKQISQDDGQPISRGTVNSELIIPFERACISPIPNPENVP
jgi:hypothetical protein